MRKLILILTLITVTTICYGQDSLKNYQNEVKHLQGIKIELTDSLKAISNKIERVSSKIAKIEFNNSKRKLTSLKLNGEAILKVPDVNKSRGTFSGETVRVPKDAKVLLLNVETNSYVRVNYEGIIGYIGKWFFENQGMIEKMIEENIKSKQREIERKKKHIDSLITAIEKDTRWIKTFNGNFRVEPSTNSDIIVKLEEGDEVFIQNKNGNWLKVKRIVDLKLRSSINNEEEISAIYQDGWVHSSIISSEEVRKLSPTIRKSKKFVRNNPQIREQFKQDILAGTIRIGMTKEMVRLARGEPDDINRTVNSYSTREQWVYGSIPNRLYVYFEDGIMTSFQD